MAATHIIYDRTKPMGALTAELASNVLAAIDSANRIMAVANALGAGSDPTTLEIGNPDGLANFGVAAGQGQGFYTALNYIFSGLNAIAKDQLANVDLGS